MTMDLVCGNLGVKADLPTAMAYAHDHGFGSVAPDAGHLGRLSDGQLSELLSDLKAKGLTWGAAGLPVDFRGEDGAFRAGMAELPAFAAALKRAGASRVGTWINPAHDRLTYVANFRSMRADSARSPACWETTACGSGWSTSGRRRPGRRGGIRSSTRWRRPAT